MPLPVSFPHWLNEFIISVQGYDTETHQAKLKAIADLRKQKLVYEEEIEHEINLLKIKFTEEITRSKEREARITKDYKEFLDQIDEMKGQIIETFPDMPKALALIIHQHAKSLIDGMWQNSDDHAKSIGRAKLADFLNVVFDDTTQVLLDQDSPKIPVKTLQLIKK